ncbi:UDP-N-acetylmuramoyl-L-alanyl-D-glutamate--2,6-diaminopimelate ligase [Pseudomethylobacillus aquaticus]|uniref:UDP-N-acetylmuramoyl-L-alanyl-D-glutamate--2, 6-diaminopimelate ligase n=1 Tax=Pseudomethylobacillus aquaticus TaxID=2676064 RepID=UPI001F018F5B|nr:UDP-N-acetylmuramoyl-L-alanyl-D-glutamate--2,6-diaminopimelate ligase [Pseudomethylobacillus aquaticus]
MSTPLDRLRALGLNIRGITADSRQVRPGSLFLAYPGEHVDGRRYIEAALRQGASAVLWEEADADTGLGKGLPGFAVRDLRAQAGQLADAFYQQPSTQLHMVGVTGTNGKTSCSHWLAQAMSALGHPTAVVGTLGNGFPGALEAAINTTPDPILLHGMLADYLARGAHGVAMEVSSHGLDQGRVNGVHFDVAVLTNLTRDHLDYHGDMAAYAAAKRKLFDWPGLTKRVLNVDDAFGASLYRELRAAGHAVLGYGLQQGEVRGSRLQLSEQGMLLDVDTPYGHAQLQAALLGRFNASNLLAVLATLLVSGVELDAAAEVLGQVQAVPGRMQRYGGGAQPLVVVDYAHTPDALDNVLNTLRIQTTGQLICVFGCGGNRDRGKRSLMAEVASRLADRVVLTSDNPRDEAPDAIIADALPGLQGKEAVIEPERAAAIHAAIAMAVAGDTVLVAGKGHEDYQEIAGVRYPFSDAAVVRLALGERT